LYINLCHVRAPGSPMALRTIDSTYIADAVAAFPRTGFHGPLNYYRSVDAFTPNSAAFAGAKIRQPSMFLAGTLDGLSRVAPPNPESMRSNLTVSSCWKASGSGHSCKHPMRRTRRWLHFCRASELYRSNSQMTSGRR
jgi:pimeloyl-ACP methyl ester carboxylesterase